MTVFEYLAIAYTLVLSFAAVRVLGALPSALTGAGRYWVYVVFLCLCLGMLVGAFWNFLLFRDVDWNFALFLLVLGQSAILYVLAAIITPANPSQSFEWHDYFLDVRRRFFVTVIAFTVFTQVVEHFLLGPPLINPIRLVAAVSVAVFAVGAASESRTVHGAVALYSLLSIAAAFAAFFASPGEYPVGG
jgi:hypothetical protein